MSFVYLGMEHGGSNHEVQGKLSTITTGESIELFQDAANDDTYLVNVDYDRTLTAHGSQMNMVEG